MNKSVEGAILTTLHNQTGNMTLCDVCNAIPLDKLSSLPLHVQYGFRSGFAHIQRSYCWREDDKGLLYHQSFEALQQAATDLNCGLCNLVLDQVLRGQAEHEELKEIWEAKSPGRLTWPLWEFWLVKRPAGGHGFWVMTFTNKRNRGEARLVAAIGLCVEDGDPLEAVIRGRPVEQQRGTPTAIRRVRSWLIDCDKHPGCRPTEPVLPSRVIDVGNEVGSPYVSLHEARDRTVEQYVALSYCWGQTPQFTTTRSTLQDRKHCIVVSHLPKTQQDAIRLTQELGMRYIWIDSICIIQDDKDDWEHESAKMLSVYANASLTIAASNGKDSHKGLFTEIPPRKYVQVDCEFGGIQGQVLAFHCPLNGETFCVETDREKKNFRFPIFLDYITLPEEPLSGRGWALQERVLSHRTLHYSDQQMFFECNEAYHGEDGLLLHARFDTIHQKIDARDKDLQDIDLKAIHSEDQPPIRRDRDESLNLWCRLLYVYGRRSLSRSSDKLPAISGLASIFAKRLNDQYVAGLWRSDLIAGLSWETLNCKRVREYRAPSWSWASIDGIVSYILDFLWKPLATIIDVEVDLKGANPYGEVLKGRIRICAPMRRLYFVGSGSMLGGDESGDQTELELRMENVEEEDIYPSFDEESLQGTEAINLECIQGKDIFALILLDRLDIADDDQPLKGLIVVKVQGGEEYERVGIIRLSRWVLKQSFGGDKAEGTTVILV